MSSRFKKLCVRVLICLVTLLLVLAGIFIYLFPWAFDNQAIADVEGPPIPILSLQSYSSDNIGARAYERACLYCHDTGIAPSLRDRSLPAALVKHFGRNGALAMPPFRASEISDEELEAIARLIEENRIPELAK